MNIWLDDKRNAPHGWVHLHNFDEVARFIETVRELKGFFIDQMSFDFHLSHPKKGVDIMKYLVDLCSQENSRRFWPKKVLYHSNDPKGIQEMKAYALNFEKEILIKFSE